MWPLVFGFLRNYAPYITIPFAAVVGVIGYNIEGILSDKHTPTIESISKQREERLLAESKLDVSLKDKTFVPKTIFERNLSPSLQEKIK